MPTTRGKRKRQTTLDGQVVEEEAGSRRSTRSSSRQKVKLNLPPVPDDEEKDPEYDVNAYSDYEDALMPEDDDEDDVDDDEDEDDFDEDGGSRKRRSRSRGKGKSSSSKWAKKYYVSEGLSLSDCEEEDAPWDEENGIEVADPEIPENSPVVAFIVLFQAQFMDFFEGVPAIGPQDVEQAIQDPNGLSGNVELFLCRTLSLMLNRKKPVEAGKYHRALEEIHSQLATLGVSQFWPEKLKLKSGKDALNVLDWKDKLEFFRMLIIWTLSNSNAIHQVLSNDSTGELGAMFQPIGSDGDKNRYYLVRGAGDTHFRVYKASNPYVWACTWISVAGNVDELESFVKTLKEEDESSSAAELCRYLSDEAVELRESEVRRRKEEQKLLRKKQLQEQAELVRSGQGLYTGRTRGKRINYNVDVLASTAEDDADLDEDIKSEREEDFNPDEADEDEEVADSSNRRRSARLRGVEAKQVSLEDLERIEEEASHNRSKIVVLKYSPQKLYQNYHQQQHYQQAAAYAYYQQHPYTIPQHHQQQQQPLYPGLPPHAQQQMRYAPEQQQQQQQQQQQPWRVYQQHQYAAAYPHQYQQYYQYYQQQQHPQYRAPPQYTSAPPAPSYTAPYHPQQQYHQYPSQYHQHTPLPPPPLQPQPPQQTVPPPPSTTQPPVSSVSSQSLPQHPTAPPAPMASSQSPRPQQQQAQHQPLLQSQPQQPLQQTQPQPQQPLQQTQPQPQPQPPLHQTQPQPQPPLQQTQPQSQQPLQQTQPQRPSTPPKPTSTTDQQNTSPSGRGFKVSDIIDPAPSSNQNPPDANQNGSHNVTNGN
ncbi:hypothetical protein TRICI_002435 [Trichomonascus ciferrii]|uniref:WHIM1 domain-containing protein n=1 Tax=Trichomonascus ciferrii TaxID=44093 RepID=A0A642V741_9ASCO|nr:hypothetical protein TRICI_002435 [Trichomonascus ciferrii]